MNAMTRRKFLDASLKGGVALAGASLLPRSATRAVEPIKRSGKPRLQLALAAYSFRETFRNKDESKRITMENFVDFCADHNCAAEVTSYFFPDPVTRDYLIKLKRQAFLRGIPISGSAVGNNFALPPGPEREKNIQLVKTWVDHCVVLGAPHIRVFAGPTQDKDIGPAKKRCIEALEECGEYAGKHGIFLGLENHGGIVTDPDDLLEIVKAVKSPWVGINLDTGNFHTDDPYADLARCAPYAVNVQVKAEIKPRGKTAKEESDVKRLVKILRDTNYQGFVALEYEAKLDPWKAVPEWLKKLGNALEV
jgi:sugar phosphate isomerase/epimerase